MNTKSLTAGLAVVAMTVGALLLTGAKGDDAPSVEWKRDLRAAHAEAKATNRPILVVFGADWCRYCGKLEKQTLGDPAVGKLVAESFVPVALDYDRDREIARILEVKSLPSTIVLSPDTDLLGRLVGFVEADRYRESLLAARNLQGRIEQIRLDEPE